MQRINVDRRERSKGSTGREGTRSERSKVRETRRDPKKMR